MFNVTGQPAAVVPWGLDGDGLPTSIQLVGRPFDEATLLSLARRSSRCGRGRNAAHWCHSPPLPGERACLRDDTPCLAYKMPLAGMLD